MKFEQLERAFIVQQKMAEYENHLLRKEVEHLRAQQKADSQLQVALSEQLKKVKYERDVWKSLAAYDSNILERFFDRDGFRDALDKSLFGPPEQAEPESEVTVASKQQASSSTDEVSVEKVVVPNFRCFHCRSDRVVKNGSKRVLCRACNRTSKIENSQA